jgi:hypothetical protein
MFFVTTLVIKHIKGSYNEASRHLYPIPKNKTMDRENANKIYIFSVLKNAFRFRLSIQGKKD